MVNEQDGREVSDSGGKDGVARRGSSLAARRILITGASGGIGAATARECARRGAVVALTARRAAPIEAIAREIRRSGGRGEIFLADLRQEDDVERMVRAAGEELGGLDSAVVAHGVNRLSTIESTTSARWDEILGTNLTASFFVARALTRVLQAPGAVVFVSSVSGLPGHRKFPGFAAYCASKRGLLGLAEVMAVELVDRGVSVYSVCPRGVETGMFRETFPGAMAELSAGEVACRVADLLDPATAPPTGAVIEL